MQHVQSVFLEKFSLILYADNATVSLAQRPELAHQFQVFFFKVYLSLVVAPSQIIFSLFLISLEKQKKIKNKKILIFVRNLDKAGVFHANMPVARNREGIKIGSTGGKTH